MTTAAFYGITNDLGVTIQRKFGLTNWQRFAVEIATLMLAASLLHKRYRPHFIRAGICSIAKAMFFPEVGTIVDLLASSTKPQLKSL